MRHQRLQARVPGVRGGRGHLPDDEEEQGGGDVPLQPRAQLHLRPGAGPAVRGHRRRLSGQFSVSQQLILVSFWSVVIRNIIPNLSLS